MLLNVQPETFFLNRFIWKLLTLCTGEGLLLGIYGLWAVRNLYRTIPTHHFVKFSPKDPPPSIYSPCRTRKDYWKPIPTFIVSKEILTWRCIFINLSNTHLTLKKNTLWFFLDHGGQFIGTFWFTFWISDYFNMIFYIYIYIYI